jgi:hypothetical protein
MSDDIVERYRIRKREQSFPGGCLALSGLVFTVFAIFAEVQLALIDSAVRRGLVHGFEGYAAAMGFGILLILGAAATVFGFSLNLVLVKYRRDGRTTRIYGLLGWIGLLMNMTSMVAFLAILLVMRNR